MPDDFSFCNVTRSGRVDHDNTLNAHQSSSRGHDAERHVLCRSITRNGRILVCGASKTRCRDASMASSINRPAARPMPKASTETVVMRGCAQRATSKSPKPAIAMRPGTSQPCRWHSITAPKADRSETQTAASTPGHRAIN